MAKISRPPKISESSYLSKYYTVEWLIRLAESRMFYIVNDHRPDQMTKYCWECGSDTSSSMDTECVSCGKPMHKRKFLISLRWEQEQTMHLKSFFEKHLTHPALLTPFDFFMPNNIRNAMILVYEWDNFEFLLERPSPRSGAEVLQIAQTALGVLAFFHENGVVLGDIGLHNFLIQPKTGEMFFFDPTVADIYMGPVPHGKRADELPSLANTLRKLVAPDEKNIHAMLDKAMQGAFQSPYEMGRAIEQLLGAFENPHLDPWSAGMSDVGLVRVLNEDNWGWKQLSSDVRLYVVADGMGGHDAGEVASSMAVSILLKECSNRISEGVNYSIDELDNILAKSFVLANNGIKDFADQRGSDMGTTMVAGLIYKNSQAIVANVGDSRAYLHRGSKLNQVSVDHSLVQRMVEQGQLTPDEARHHPHSNILMRTVGTERDVLVDTFHVDLQSGDSLLLCSDGLWGETEDIDMERILNQVPEFQEKAVELIYLAHNGGGKDNVSLILAKVP